MAVLAVHFENGRVLLRANGGSMPHRSQQDLYDQLIQFPAAPHDDLCDALDFAVQAAQQSNVQLRIL
jgi:phage terminase large subunit-like protein